MKTTKSTTTAKIRIATMAMVATATLTIAGAVGAVQPRAAYAAGTGSVTFTQPGSSSWTVPPGVNTATIEVVGAGGGRYGNPFLAGYRGGAGGEIDATLTIFPGETLSLLVGAAGGDVNDGQTDPGSGGLGGGGNGGQCTGLASPGSCTPGAGGGGSSSVYRNSTPLFVAGGGGGASSLGDGGSGGGQTGGLGSDQSPATGGSQTAGGAAGHDALVGLTDGAGVGSSYNGGWGGRLCTCSLAFTGPLSSDYAGGG